MQESRIVFIRVLALLSAVPHVKCLMQCVLSPYVCMVQAANANAKLQVHGAAAEGDQIPRTRRGIRVKRHHYIPPCTNSSSGVVFVFVLWLLPLSLHLRCIRREQNYSVEQGTRSKKL